MSRTIFMCPKCGSENERAACAECEPPVRVQPVVSKYPLQVVVGYLLLPGCMGRDKDGNAIMIWLAKGLERDEATVTLWHEILHVLHNAGGTDHDEDAIEAMAQKLAQACPEVLKICGVAAHFANAELTHRRENQ